MTPLLETALGNGNLHTHLKILFIRRKLFHIFGGCVQEGVGGGRGALEQKYRIIVENQEFGPHYLVVTNANDYDVASEPALPTCVRAPRAASPQIQLLLQFKNQALDLTSPQFSRCLVFRLMIKQGCYLRITTGIPSFTAAD